MISFHRPSAVCFIAGLWCISAVTMSAPAFAHGSGGGGGGGMRGGPGGGPPPVFVEGSTAGRTVGSCAYSRGPVTNTSGRIIGYRRVQFCK
jgi:hypothetical protein